MTGSAAPLTELGSQASQLDGSELPGLEAFIKQHWTEVVPQPDPRLNANRAAESFLPHSLGRRLQMLAPTDSGVAAFLERLECALHAQGAPGQALDIEEDIDPDIPLGLAPMGAPQACMQALVQDFSRRQRQATMFVTGCIAASCLLTVVGITALASLTGPQAARSEDPARRHSNSAVWHDPVPAALPVTLVSASPDRSGKSDSLYELARLEAVESERRLRVAFSERSASRPQLILMRAGRPISLAPLIEPRRAAYVLIRGLPEEARLSAGQRSPRGAWLIRADDIGSLSLSIDGDASGDYTAEIYALGANALPQGRQRLVFRVEPAFARAAADDLNWAATLRDMANAARSGSVRDPRLVDPGEASEESVQPERVSEFDNKGRKILASLSD